MLVGIPPFYNENIHHMYLLIKRTDVKWPTLSKHGVELSREAKDLISKVTINKFENFTASDKRQERKTWSE